MSTILPLPALDRTAQDPRGTADADTPATCFLCQFEDVFLLSIDVVSRELRPSRLEFGSVAVPGLVGVAPGSGLIMIEPVSVCHHVSTIGQRPPPITR